MNVGSYIFSQVVDYIPRYQFDKLVAKYHGNWHSKDLTCYNQLLHLLFGQITGCGSLRDICLCNSGARPQVACVDPVNIQKLLKSIDEIKRPFAFKE